jgi:hypothetical protein
MFAYSSSEDVKQINERAWYEWNEVADRLERHKEENGEES